MKYTKSIFLLLFVAISLLSFSVGHEEVVSSSHYSTVDLTERKNLLSRENFNDSLTSLYQEIGLSKKGLSFDVFRKGMIGFYSLKSAGKLNDKNLLTIIDFTKPSTEKRFYTIDLDRKEILFHSLVAHGNRTGENLAKHFSNRPHSNQSSLGFYITGETYVGSKGYSMRLDGQERLWNDKIRARAVVVHAAHYVSQDWIKRYGRLGRSQGCPALPVESNKKIIDTIKDKTVMFAYFQEPTYLNSSAFLNFDTMINSLEARTSNVNSVSVAAE